MLYRNLISCLVFLSAAISVKSQTSGCTDIAATNYNSIATINDGSCIYNDAAISPETTIDLSQTLNETSGLTFWNNLVWTFNDNDDINLYGLDTLTAEIVEIIEITGSQNVDWEAVTQDDSYFYIGDFGNNAHGNRTDLKIYKTSKSSLLAGVPEIEIISFNYPEQTSFEPTAGNETDFDCEAMAVMDGQIYLFTKRWVSSGTSVYSIPNQAGNYAAELINSYPVDGLITGSTLLQDESLLILCGYSEILQPFIFMLYDFESDNFFGANKRLIQLSLPFHQIEGISCVDGNKLFLSNEKFAPNILLEVDAQLHFVDINSILVDYILNNNQSIDSIEYSVHPNPFINQITVKLNHSAALSTQQIQIRDMKGVVYSTISTDNKNRIKIDLSNLIHGEYILEIVGPDFRKSSKLIK